MTTNMNWYNKHFILAICQESSNKKRKWLKALILTYATIVSARIPGYHEQSFTREKVWLSFFRVNSSHISRMEWSYHIEMMYDVHELCSFSKTLIVTIQQSKAFPAFVVLFFCFDTSCIAIVMLKTYLQYTLNKYCLRLWGLNLITAVECISCYSMVLLSCLVYCSCYRYIRVIFEQVLELDCLYKVILWKRGSPFDRSYTSA